MAGQNTLIIASDYNTIQSKINLVLGSGSGTTGYGQVVSSSQVAANAKVTVEQWNNLRNDIVKVRQHQLGTTIGTKAPETFGYVAGSDLPIPTADEQVKESWRAAYLSMATDAETWQTSRTSSNSSIAPPESQATLAKLVSDQVRTASWNGRISQTLVVSWTTADEARYFWNSGGQIQFSADRSGGSAGLKNVTWTTMLTGMGTIIIDYTKTTYTGADATPSSIGWYDLTTSDQLLFEKDAPTGAYTPNKFFVYGRVNSTSDRKVGYFTFWFGDDSLAPPSYPDPGFGVDENVDGTLLTQIYCYRATGTNVSVPQPSASTTGIA